MVDPGWKDVAKVPEKKKTGSDDSGLVLSAEFDTGEEISFGQAGVKAGKTTPPKAYTEDLYCKG